MQGDIVAYASNPQAQTGTVVEVKIQADLLFPNDVKLYGVDSKLLQHIHPYHSGTYVVKNSWLGRVEEVMITCIVYLFSANNCIKCAVDVSVVFTDGSMCIIENADPDSLPTYFGDEDVNENTYYPTLVI